MSDLPITGMTLSEARAWIAKNMRMRDWPRLYEVGRDGAPMPDVATDPRFGRVNAWTQDGVIVRCEIIPR